MTFNVKWEEVHSKKGWGLYPNEEVIRWVQRNYGMTPKKHRNQVKFLDIGCGQGSSTWFLAREGYQVTAADGSKSALTKLHKRIVDEGLDVEIAFGDISKLQYPDQYFDAAIDVVSVCHNLNYLDIYNEIARLLKRGGRLFSVVPKDDCFPGPFSEYGDFQFFTLEMIRRVLNGKFTYKIGSIEVMNPGDPPVKTLKFWLVDALRIT